MLAHTFQSHSNFLFHHEHPKGILMSNKRRVRSALMECLIKSDVPNTRMTVPEMASLPVCHSTPNSFRIDGTMSAFLFPSGDWRGNPTGGLLVGDGVQGSSRLTMLLN